MTTRAALDRALAAVLDTDPARVAIHLIGDPYIHVSYRGNSAADANRLFAALGVTDAHVNHDPGFLGHSRGTARIGDHAVEVRVLHVDRPAPVIGAGIRQAANVDERVPDMPADIPGTRRQR
ncbi:MAG TPA: hypothetical protein VFM55_19185 [Micromonosporaceae bacterium]|nr:hypothetical protein [Micromonosporaceae bacterium]